MYPVCIRICCIWKSFLVLDVQVFAIQFAPVGAIWFPSGFVDCGVFEVKAKRHTYWSDIVHPEQHKKFQPKISSVQHQNHKRKDHLMWDRVSCMAFTAKIMLYLNLVRICCWEKEHAGWYKTRRYMDLEPTSTGSMAGRKKGQSLVNTRSTLFKLHLVSLDFSVFFKSSMFPEQSKTNYVHNFAQTNWPAPQGPSDLGKFHKWSRRPCRSMRVFYERFEIWTVCENNVVFECFWS